MGKRRQSPKRLFPDGTDKRGRLTFGSSSDGSVDETTMRYEPVVMGSPSSLSFAAKSAFAMACAREDCVRRITLVQTFHCSAPGPPPDGFVDEITMRELAMMRARDILAKELHGLVYVDCAVIDVAGGEKAGLIKLIIE